VETIEYVLVNYTTKGRWQAGRLAHKFTANSKTKYPV
jgi:hypothetical protein